MKHVNLEKPTTLLDPSVLGMLNREWKPNKNLVDECRKMLESLITARAIE